MCFSQGSPKSRLRGKLGRRSLAALRAEAMQSQGSEDRKAKKGQQGARLRDLGEAGGAAAERFAEQARLGGLARHCALYRGRSPLGLGYLEQGQLEACGYLPLSDLKGRTGLL